MLRETQLFTVLLMIYCRDHSIPRIDKVMLNEADNLTKLEGFIKDQVTFETRIEERVEEERVGKPYPDPTTECVPPTYVHVVIWSGCSIV